MPSGEPIVCVLRHDGQPIYQGDWGGSLLLHKDEWHVYLPEDGGDPTMHAVLDDAVKRLVEAAYRAGGRAMSDFAAGAGIKSAHVELPVDPYEEPEGASDNHLERIAEMTAEERERYGE